MWDNHQMLGFTGKCAVSLLAALITAYFLCKWIINLPILPFERR